MADEALKHALKSGKNPERTSPIFDDSSDDSDSEIDTFDIHQEEELKKGKKLIEKYFKHQSQKQKEAAEKEKAAAKKAVKKEIEKKNKTRKKRAIEMITFKTNQGGKRKRKRKTRKRKRKRRRKRKTRKKRKVKRRLTKKRR